jgi:hypothetical protein
MIATHQVLTVKEDLFSKEVMKQFKQLLDDSTLLTVSISVDKINKVAVLEAKESGDWIVRIVVLAFDQDRIKKAIKHTDLRIEVVRELHNRQVKQRDIALLLSISQPSVSKIVKEHR